MFGQGNRLILLIDICKGAVKLGPPPPLTAKVGTYVYFLANFFFFATYNIKWPESGERVGFGGR